VVAVRLHDRESLPLLLHLLTTPETWEKPAVLVALGRIGDPTAAPALVAWADHPAHWIRVCAVHALGELDVPESRTVARAHLKDPYWSVRGAAAIALGAVGSPDDLGPLLECLRDEHPWARRGASYALGRLGLTEAAPRLREGLRDPAAEVRLAAVWALGHLGDDGARDDLVRLLYETRPKVAAHGPPEAEGPEGHVSDTDTRLFDAVVQALGRLSHGAPDPLIQRSLVDARERLSDEQLDRRARLPLPEVEADQPAPTLRTLFEIALPSSADDEDSPG
jgi:HEAT repeat protein